MNAPLKAVETVKRFQPRTDPTTFEVLRHRLWQINDEQGQTLLKMSGSAIATEANDFNIAIADAQGNLIVVGPYILIQMAPLTLLVQSVIRTLGDEVAEGDAYLCNDPWFGAVHQNDVCVLAPFFWKGKLIAWTASVVHQMDVGGGAPGSWCSEATETFQEAPRYRFLKVMRDGKLQKEVVDTYLTNSRTPDLVELDLRAQVGAARVTLQRLGELFQRYGEDVVTATMNDLLDYSERLMEAKLATIPDGQWLSDCYLDHDGRKESTHRYAVRLQKSAAGLTFDYTETDPQIAAFINCPYGGLFAATYVALLVYLCSDIPWNSGIMRRVRIVSKEGALNHARFPAAVSGSLESIWNSWNAACGAVGKMLVSSPQQVENAMAVWQGSTLVFTMFGLDQRNERYGGLMINSGLGGGGARTFGDGHDTCGPLVAPRYSAINVEQAEQLYPLLYLYRKRASDSGGPGAWRGGVASESAITAYGTSEIQIRMTTSGTDHSHTTGLSGGYPGGGSVARLARGAMRPDGAGGVSLPADWSEIAGGVIEPLAAKSNFRLVPGDIFSTIPHGGGGYGDPIERDPERVRRDVFDGCVSTARAAETYGVVLEGVELAVNREATASRRGAIRAGRTGPSRSVEHRHVADTPRDAAPGSAGAALINGAWQCGGCGHRLATRDRNAKEGCVTRRRPVGAAGPLIAVSTGGDSRQFHLVEYSCPECARLLFVDERPKTESGPWHDFRPD